LQVEVLELKDIYEAQKMDNKITSYSSCDTCTVREL